MTHRRDPGHFLFAPLLAVALAVVLPASAQAPGDVQNLLVDSASTLSWDPVSGADDYNVYRGKVGELSRGVPPRCHGDEIVATSFASPAEPAPGGGYLYLVTAESDLGGEGSPGVASDALERDLLGSCDGVMRHHLLGRAGYGWNEWSRDRLATLGRQGYLGEQLDPATLDESDNTELNDRLGPIDPPLSYSNLFGQQIVRGVYARRQLEQQTATFWANHLNSSWIENAIFFNGLYPPCSTSLPYCDPNYPEIRDRLASELSYRELESFRNLAFNGTFRQIAEASALGPSMIIFLDTDTNTRFRPNENFARELLELYTMGVDGGYTQQDVEEVARVFTGWNVCKKLDPDAGDPLAPCQLFYWLVQGTWVENFRVNEHDCGEKILFEATAHEAVIPDTCDGVGEPTAAGIDDVDLALDAILAHPATPRFIAKKMIQRFVTEDPTTEQIDAVVAAWNDGANPLGVGDLREVLRETLSLPAFLDPDAAGGKVKTPIEHTISMLRGVRGKTDGVSVLGDYVVRMQHLPQANQIPTGYSELGADWIDTNNMLERQNLGMDLVPRDPVLSFFFSAEIIALLNDSGVSTAPGNAEAIVDFFAEALFGGALTPAERQEAVDYLNTDDTGANTAYDEARIRETVGFLLGYPHFVEQ